MMRAEVVVITGAGSGLGRATAVALARSGHRLVLVGRTAEKLGTTASRCMAAGSAESSLLLLPADLNEPGVPSTVVAAACASFGQIDAVVNNAAIARVGMIEDAAPTTFEALLRTNVVAPAALIAAATPALRATRGVVVNVGSIGGVMSLPGRAPYGASKAALHHLTRSLARELAPDIRVNAVVPGAIDTEMYDSLDLDQGAVEAMKAELIRTTPLRRMGTPEDVVPWIELLLGPAGNWVTGSVIVVDGGRSC